MKNLSAFLILFWSALATASDAIEWSGLATIEKESIELKAKEYINSAMPEIRGAEIKLMSVNASYDFRFEHSNLHVMFMHSMSFLEGEAEERVVYVDDQPQVIKMNKIQYIFVDFQIDGNPYKHRIEKVPFNGSKDDFLEEFGRF
ncbi:hypothetical protein [Alteromonas facilis]|uniref:hypothetical protein n=1 Tax=Alteromonas facilis TaxID=2048004 RepID=UPI000C285E3D|nr:hypothetical protein [Alteromonas facilis]